MISQEQWRKWFLVLIYNYNHIFHSSIKIDWGKILNDAAKKYQTLKKKLHPWRRVVLLEFPIRKKLFIKKDLRIPMKYLQLIVLMEPKSLWESITEILWEHNIQQNKFWKFQNSQKNNTEAIQQAKKKSSI